MKETVKKTTTAAKKTSAKTTVKKTVAKKTSSKSTVKKTTEIKQTPKNIKLSFKGIRKTFLNGKIVANNNVTFDVAEGSIHAIIGENGAGKSTLMSTLFGLYQPDTGTIEIDGKEVKISNPHAAGELGIGMVHQHFKLVGCLTCLENAILGQEGKKAIIDYKTLEAKFNELAKKYKFDLDPNDLVDDISIGKKQKIEILKMLWQDKDVVIFDEPTAVLTPDEISGFLQLLVDFKNKGKTVIIITHKLNEVKEVADNYTVLRKGEVVASGVVKTTSIPEMAKQMVGKEVTLNIKNPNVKAGKLLYKFENISYTNDLGVKKLDNVSFELYENEIVGLAGVEGNGQTELIKIMVGLLKPDSGRLLMYKDGEVEHDVTHLSIKKRIELGLSHIPEDRHSYGLVLDYSCAENTILQEAKKFSKWGMLDRKKIYSYAQEIIKTYDVRGTNEGKAPARGLSGGNQQKLIIGREITRSHDVLIAAQPTRGLDVGTIENIYNLIIKDKQNKNAILLLSYELNEITSASDRVLVINNGQIMGELKGKDINNEKIGMLFASGKKQEAKQVAK